MQAVAIIPAAGRGLRMRSTRPKALTRLLDRPLLAWTLEPTVELGVFSEILVAGPPGEGKAIARILEKDVMSESRIRVIDGGQTRQESVENCLHEISVACELVAVHDAARPLMTPQLMLDVLERASETDAAIAAVPCKDTVKLCDKDNTVSETLDRSRVWLVQTPQCFSYDLLVSAYDKARQDGYIATDDAALVERIGIPVHVVMGSYENIKITTPEDISICENLLNQRQIE